MTGLRIITRGSSFLKASAIAGMAILVSVSVVAEPRMRLLDDSIGTPFWDLVEGAGVHRQMLDDRAERHRREVDKTASDQDDADQEPDEEPAIGRKGAG